MIDVTTAANKAVEYLRSLYPSADNITLEEVESSDDKKFWLITLSYQVTEKSTGIGGWALPQRKLKIFKIDSNNGEVVSMKIRELNV